MSPRSDPDKSAATPPAPPLDPKTGLRQKPDGTLILDDSAIALPPDRKTNKTGS